MIHPTLDFKNHFYRVYGLQTPKTWQFSNNITLKKTTTSEKEKKAGYFKLHNPTDSSRAGVVRRASMNDSNGLESNPQPNLNELGRKLPVYPRINRAVTLTTRLRPSAGHNRPPSA